MKKVVKKSTKYKRPSWDEYFLKMVEMVGTRGTCDIGGSGCVITIDNRIVSTGYTGSLSGLPHCDDVGHDLKSGICQRTIHAEHNAISQALKFGISLDGAIMYCKATPCTACVNMATSLGIKKIISEKK